MAGQTPAEYISHHVQNLTFGVKKTGELGLQKQRRRLRVWAF